MSTRFHPPTNYALFVRIIHWAFIPLIVCSIVTGKIMTQVGYEDPLSYYLPQYHYLSGLTLLILLIIRIVGRLSTPSPKYSTSITLPNIVIAKSVQALMLLSIATALISGYFLATADGNPAKLPWGTWLIQVTPNDAFTLETMLKIHTTALISFFVLLFAHIAGFIKQQFHDTTFFKRIL